MVKIIVCEIVLFLLIMFLSAVVVVYATIFVFESFWCVFVERILRVNPCII